MARGHTTIKAVVIGLGLGIVGLTILVVMVIIDKAGDSLIGTEGAITETLDYADVAIALPSGAEVMTMAGQGDVLSLLVRLDDGSQQIVTVDRRSGEVLGTLELIPRNP